jgi:hypothetical protein
VLVLAEQAEAQDRRSLAQQERLGERFDGCTGSATLDGGQSWLRVLRKMEGSQSATHQVGQFCCLSSQDLRQLRWKQ